PREGRGDARLSRAGAGVLGGQAASRRRTSQSPVPPSATRASPPRVSGRAFAGPVAASPPVPVLVDPPGLAPVDPAELVPSEEPLPADPELPVEEPVLPVLPDGMARSTTSRFGPVRANARKPDRLAAPRP